LRVGHQFAVRVAVNVVVLERRRAVRAKEILDRGKVIIIVVIAISQQCAGVVKGGAAVVVCRFVVSVGARLCPTRSCQVGEKRGEIPNSHEPTPSLRKKPSFAEFNARFLPDYESRSIERVADGLGEEGIARDERIVRAVRRVGMFQNADPFGSPTSKEKIPFVAARAVHVRHRSRWCQKRPLRVQSRDRNGNRNPWGWHNCPAGWTKTGGRGL